MLFNVETEYTENDQNTTSVDWDELNKYVVDTAQLETRETLKGVIAGLVDLGIQEQEDAEIAFDGTPEEEAEIIAKFPDTYFKDGIDFQTKKEVRYRCWKQKPIQSVTFAIDFPDIMIDKGQFFGESNPKPLRLYLGGQFYFKDVGMVVSRPMPLKVVNLDKTRKTKKWSLAQNSTIYKMAVGAKLINNGDQFLPQEIAKLVGKTLQFNAQVFFNKGKNGGEYYTEYVNFAAGLSRGDAEFDYKDTFMIQFNVDNDLEAVKELRNHVKNTIKRATNYDGSKIQSELGDTATGEAPSNPTTVKVDEVKHKAPPAPQDTQQQNDDLDDDTLPF